MTQPNEKEHNTELKKEASEDGRIRIRLLRAHRFLESCNHENKLEMRCGKGGDVGNDDDADEIDGDCE